MIQTLEGLGETHINNEPELLFRVLMMPSFDTTWCMGIYRDGRIYLKYRTGFEIQEEPFEPSPVETESLDEPEFSLSKFRPFNWKTLEFKSNQELIREGELRESLRSQKEREEKIKRSVYTRRLTNRLDAIPRRLFQYNSNYTPDHVNYFEGRIENVRELELQIFEIHGRHPLEITEQMVLDGISMTLELPNFNRYYYLQPGFYEMETPPEQLVEITLDLYEEHFSNVTPLMRAERSALRELEPAEFLEGLKGESVQVWAYLYSMLPLPSLRAAIDLLDMSVGKEIMSRVEGTDLRQASPEPLREIEHSIYRKLKK